MTALALKGKVDWAALTAQSKAEYSAVRAHRQDVHEERAWFARIESMGHDYLAQALGDGHTISELALINSVPAIYMMRYIQKKMPKDLVADARRAAASTYAARAGLALEMPDENHKNFNGQVQLAKSRSEHYMTMAERLAPEDFAPPVPTQVIIPPVGITMHFDRSAPPIAIPEQYSQPVFPGGLQRPVEDATLAGEEQVLSTFDRMHKMQDLDQKYRVNQGKEDAVDRVLKK
jgi:hypothetical protein